MGLTKSFLCILMLALTACIIAPLRTPHTGRTLGKGNWQIDAGPYLPHFAVFRGFSKNLDLGLTLEQQLFIVTELSGKYALLNNGKGLSLAAYGGYYFGDGQGFRIGPILSYKFNGFEPFLALHYTEGYWAGRDLSDNDDSFFESLKYDKTYYYYMQYTFGLNYWFSEGFALNLNARGISHFGRHLKPRNNDLFPGMSFIWRF